MILALLLADAAQAAAAHARDRLFRLRVLGASGILFFALLMLFVIVVYLLRRWRRAMREPLPPSEFDADAWARKPLVPPDEIHSDEPV